MRLKDLFTVPKGHKVTEKHLRRVLISSICSILLCMSCLTGTTWAWFTVSIENTGNVIEIGKPEIRLTVDGSEYEPGTTLSAGPYTLSIQHANEVDDLQRKSTLYVTLSFRRDDGMTTVYTTLNHENQYEASVTIQSEKDYTLGWTVSWFAPANAVALSDSTITLTAEEAVEPSTEVTTEPSGEASTDETNETQAENPTDSSEESDEDDKTDSSADATTVPSGETSTEAATETPTEDATDSEEESDEENTNTPSTGATTEPSGESSTEAATETPTGDTSGTEEESAEKDTSTPSTGATSEPTGGDSSEATTESTETKTE